jgi:hypothetical protein
VSGNWAGAAGTYDVLLHFGCEDGRDGLDQVEEAGY